MLNCVYAWAVDRMATHGPDKLEQWLALLSDPLPGRERKTGPVDAEQEMADFEQFMSLGG